MIMKIKLLMLALCLSHNLVIASNSKDKPELKSGTMNLSVSDTSVYFYYTNAYNINKKQKIILAFWVNGTTDAESSMGEEGLYKIRCELIKSLFNKKLKCVGKFEGKIGKGTVVITGKKYDVSNGRLFLVDVYEKPLKVIQINENFDLHPFNEMSSLDNMSFNERSVAKSFSSCQKKFEYLAKNNKKVAAFLAYSKKKLESLENKSKKLKKKD